MIAIKGIGWVGRGRFGCVRKGENNPCDGFDTDGKWMGKSLFAYPFKSFGRLDDVSRNVCHAVALAMRDADIAYSMGFKHSIGIIGCNATGSLEADASYFKDYLEGGRTLGRGNLFIYTLPSSPLGEAAIHFGLLGPMFYTTGQGLLGAIGMAGDIIESGECSTMLVGEANEREGIYFVLQPSEAGCMDAQQISMEITKIKSEVLKA